LDKDFLSKSDPMCVVYHRPLGAKKWVELIRSEYIKDNLNPDFIKKVRIPYKVMMMDELYITILMMTNQSIVNSHHSSSRGYHSKFSSVA
jgi:hypothetical protein